MSDEDDLRAMCDPPWEKMDIGMKRLQLELSIESTAPKPIGELVIELFSQGHDDVIDIAYLFLDREKKGQLGRELRAAGREDIIGVYKGAHEAYGRSFTGRPFFQEEMTQVVTSALNRDRLQLFDDFMGLHPDNLRICINKLVSEHNSGLVEKIGAERISTVFNKKAEVEGLSDDNYFLLHKLGLLDKDSTDKVQRAARDIENLLKLYWGTSTSEFIYSVFVQLNPALGNEILNFTYGSDILGRELESLQHDLAEHSTDLRIKVDGDVDEELEAIAKGFEERFDMYKAVWYYTTRCDLLDGWYQCKRERVKHLVEKGRLDVIEIVGGERVRQFYTHEILEFDNLLLDAYQKVYGADADPSQTTVVADIERSRGLGILYDVFIKLEFHGRRKYHALMRAANHEEDSQTFKLIGKLNQFYDDCSPE